MEEINRIVFFKDIDIEKCRYLFDIFIRKNVQVSIVDSKEILRDPYMLEFL